ncbi:MAG: hypothetical protein Q8T13_19515 [Acidobacteriota bacterium]|nr:hypothetical protein [Acidobacteriota bacterium]
MAASGSTFSSVNCPGSGKMDLIYVRDYTPTSAGVDLTALKAVLTSCVTTADAPALSGELAMAGTYTGSGQAAPITLTGSLTTSAGGCAITGAVTAAGSFSGTACGATVAATTPPPIATPTPAPAPTLSATGTWTGTWTNYDPRFSCGRSDNSVRMTLTQSGANLSGSMTWTITSSYYSPDVGKTQTFEITGTANGSAVTLTLGPASGTATMTATSMTGAFTMPAPGTTPCPLPNSFTLSRQ